jgi:C4-dicarboxylate-specific signal transduction histidine kinase
MTTLGSVVSAVVHDLNNVLQTISGSVELMQARGDLSVYSTEKVARVGAQAARAMTIVADLAVFARVAQSGNASADLSEVLNRAMALRRRHLAGSRIAVDIESESSEPVQVRMGEQQVLQIVLNLLMNAEQALQSTEGPRIGVRIFRENGFVRLVVADNGAGVPDDRREWAFEPFTTSRPAGQAAGLGLAVTSAIVRASGGRMAMAANAQGGTDVSVELPEAT